MTNGSAPNMDGVLDGGLQPFFGWTAIRPCLDFRARRAAAPGANRAPSRGG